MMKSAILAVNSAHAAIQYILETKMAVRNLLIQLVKKGIHSTVAKQIIKNRLSMINPLKVYNKERLQICIIR